MRYSLKEKKIAYKLIVKTKHDTVWSEPFSNKQVLYFDTYKELNKFLNEKQLRFEKDNLLLGWSIKIKTVVYK